MKKNAKSKLKTILIITLLLLSAPFSIFFSSCGTSPEKKDEASYREQAIELYEAAKYEEAAKMFDMALEKSSGAVSKMDIDICYYKADSLLLSGQLSEAKEAANGMIEYDDDLWGAYFLRGKISLEEGNTDAAKSDFDIAIEKNPKDLELYIAIYEALSDTDGEGAAQYLEEASSPGDDSAKGLRCRGYVSYLEDDPYTALDLFDKAMEKGDEKACLYKAEVLIDLGKSDEALSIIEEKLSASSDPVEYEKQYRYDQVIAYEYGGDFETAKTLMQSYIDDYPGDEEALEEYRFLETR